ncbi:uncharacterized protein LOC18011018 isoform X2 [Eutrema salsugineum]|uniref:uncharacterized protein LOC18011018 isoform X2 n=1 Tax=Eutrema salsugineum TaxID=72664 RepID=UPI000CED79D5|nr:uncharacterized protein LOC18011018 isoform X2 [Eutrema salsugineum]
MATPYKEERVIQKSYLKENSSDLTVEAIMLDSKDSDPDKEERPEVLSLIPPYEGKTVLELGAGIGHFTGELAQKAGEVIALDFIESAIKKNASVNGHYKNVKFMCADVRSPDLKITDASIDLIFSNWLLMYLSDKEVELFSKRMLGWIKPGGYIFFRESCFHQSGDSKRKSNPTHYREQKFYTKIFQECQTRDASGNSFELSMVGCKRIGAYVKNKKNQNQICWIWQKVSLENDKDLQRSLDNVQYKSNGILRFGQGYVNSQQESVHHDPFSIFNQVPLFSTQCTEASSHGEDERRKRRKWTPADDALLISSWLNTSKDPVVGSEQKLGAYWRRIAAYFAASSGGREIRQPSHCKQRWQKINDLVCKFCGSYEAATREKASGQNDNDVLKLAHEIFYKDHKKTFTLEHAWKELRNDQKWCNLSTSKTEGSSKKRRCDVDAQSASSQAEETNTGEEDLGVKAAKDRGKRHSVEGKALAEFQSLEVHGCRHKGVSEGRKTQRHKGVSQERKTQRNKGVSQGFSTRQEMRPFFFIFYFGRWVGFCIFANI